MTEIFAATYGWKRCYYWISRHSFFDSSYTPRAQEDLKTYTDPEQLCEEVQELSDPLKRQYRFSRGMEMFPQSPSVLQNYADFLIERPDENDSWNLAHSFYKKALSLTSSGKSKTEKVIEWSLLFIY